MKLRNKKTGEIVDFDIFATSKYLNRREIKTNFGKPISLAELNEEWQDYEEPKEYWFIGYDSQIESISEEDNDARCIELDKEIGNYFETKEEAEKAVEKLRAWKRLKDKGFRFDCWDENHHNLGIAEFSFPSVENSVYEFQKDLDLLFGGEA